MTDPKKNESESENDEAREAEKEELTDEEAAGAVGGLHGGVLTPRPIPPGI